MYVMLCNLITTYAKIICLTTETRNANKSVR